MRISSSLAVNGELKLLARRPGDEAFCVVELMQPTTTYESHTISNSYFDNISTLKDYY